MKRRVVLVAVSLLAYDGPLRIVAGPVLMGDEIAWAAESTTSLGNDGISRGWLAPSAPRWRRRRRDPGPVAHLGAGAACRTNGGPGFALSGDQLAVSGCAGVTVRDLAHPDVSPEVLTAAGGPVKLTGGWAAWQTNTASVRCST